MTAPQELVEIKSNEHDIFAYDDLKEAKDLTLHVQSADKLLIYKIVKAEIIQLDQIASAEQKQKLDTMLAEMKLWTGVSAVLQIILLTSADGPQIAQVAIGNYAMHALIVFNPGNPDNSKYLGQLVKLRVFRA